MYDVYYTTAGGPWFNSGADIWVTEWIKEVAPHLEVKSLLLFHRKRPDNYEEFHIFQQAATNDAGLQIVIAEYLHSINLRFSHIFIVVS